MRIPLGAGAWLDYDPEWLPSEEADHALTGLRGELSWEQREIVLFGRRVLQPRLIAWAGDRAYRYSGQTLEPRPFTPTVGRMLANVSARAGMTFNHVLVNRYRREWRGHALVRRAAVARAWAPLGNAAARRRLGDRGAGLREDVHCKAGAALQRRRQGDRVGRSARALALRAPQSPGADGHSF